MGLLDKVNNLREKANRLGLDEAVDQRTKDRNDEARKRLDAGRKTLTAVLEGNPDAIRTKVSELSGQGEVVGKITRVMSDVAPVLQQNAPAVKHVVAQIDAATSELKGHGADLKNAAGRVETAMNNLIASTNLPANALPKDLVSDLVADAVQDNTPKTTENEETAAASEPTSAVASPTPTAPTKKKKKKKKQLAELAAMAKQTATGRTKLGELARNTGLLDSFRVPSTVVEVAHNPAAAVHNATNAVKSTVQNAVAGGGFGRVLGGLGGLGGGGFEMGPVSVGRDGVTLSKDVGGGVEGSVTVGPDGVTLDASRDVGGGTTGTVGVTMGSEGPSVHGELSRETALGTVTAGVEAGAGGPAVYGEVEGRYGHGSVSAGSDGVTAEGKLGPLSGSIGPAGISTNARDLASGRTIRALAGNALGGMLGGRGGNDAKRGERDAPSLDALRRTFGRHDAGDVRAHAGQEEPAATAAMGATAFATGDAIAFAPGGMPQLDFVGHEATHTVQQSETESEGD